MIIEEVYDALIEAGASEERARAAARAIADYDKRFPSIDREISGFRSNVDREFGETRGVLKLHSWILTTNSAMLVAILFRVFSR